MNQLVIGRGEVGRAVANVLNIPVIDYGESYEHEVDVLHICFPYSDEFVEYVKGYEKLYKSDLTIIHSTVPLGTTDKLGAVHSPVRGVHPHLERSLKTFVKYFGGRKAPLAGLLWNVSPVEIVDDARTTEAMKLWSTTQYGWNIILEKEIHKYCLQNDVDFDLVYTEANKTYNEGYKKLGMPQFQKYVLEHMDGKIGGHCVTNNCELLASDLAKYILEKNDVL